MEGLYILIAILALHVMLFFFDVLFKSCLHVPYLSLLQNTGLEVGILRIRWFTTALNRSFQRWSQWRPSLQAAWFSAGVVCSLLLMPVAAFLVLRGLFSSTDETPQQSGFELEPVVPGVNLPVNQLGNYMTSLAVGGILHELGHALAAAREGVPVLGCGVQLLLVMPVANVDLSTQRLSALSAWRQLRVLCAGVWHNVVLALLAIMLLNAITYIPAYTLGKGVAVTHVTQGSGISGPGGLQAGDHIISIQQCQVSNTGAWQRCIARASVTPQDSYCAPVSLLGSPSGEGKPCCEGASARNLCFTSDKERWCLPAREVVEVSTIAASCPSNTKEVTPDLSDEANSTKLLVINRSSPAPSVLFLGNPQELFVTIKTSDWLPVFPTFLPSWLPEIIHSACSYIAALSAGLALLNLLPCYGFDGHHITGLLLKSALFSCGVRSSVAASTANAGLTAVGTGCLLAWLFTAVWKLDY